MRLLAGILAFVIISVNGHATFRKLRVDGKLLGQLEGISAPPESNPITSLNDQTLACNIGFKRPDKIIDISAGAQVAALWGHIVTGAMFPGDPDEPISPSHKGATTVYMAKDEAGDGKPSDLNWFKIAHDGVKDGVWGVDRMIEAKGFQDFTIPTCIPDGIYLLRVEIIAVQVAKTVGGAQLYMGCARVKITGGKGTLPTETVKIPGVYKADQPGIKLDIYDENGIPNNAMKPYPIPGPEPLQCVSIAGRTSAPSSAPPPAPGTSPTASATPSSTPSDTSSTPTPTSRENGRRRKQEGKEDKKDKEDGSGSRCSGSGGAKGGKGDDDEDEEY